MKYTKDIQEYILNSIINLSNKYVKGLCDLDYITDKDSNGIISSALNTTLNQESYNDANALRIYRKMSEEFYDKIFIIYNNNSIFNNIIDMIKSGMSKEDIMLNIQKII